MTDAEENLRKQLSQLNVQTDIILDGLANVLPQKTENPLYKVIKKYSTVAIHTISTKAEIIELIKKSDQKLLDYFSHSPVVREELRKVLCQGQDSSVNVLNGVVDSFWSRYRGDAHVLLKEHLNECYKTRQKTQYSDYVLVCNGSGTGKTFTVCNLTQLKTYVVYFNFNRKSTGYPFPTFIDIYDIICSHPSYTKELFTCLTIAGLEIVVACLLYRITPEELLPCLINRGQHSQTLKSDNIPSTKNLPLCTWISQRVNALFHMITTGQIEFDHLVTLRLEIFQSLPFIENSNFDFVQPKGISIPKLNDFTRKKKTFADRVEQIQTFDQEWIKNNITDDAVKIVLVSDEIMGLDDVENNVVQKGSVILDLRRSMNFGECSHTIAVFSDTISSLPVLSPAQYFDNTDRGQNPESDHYSPFYILPPETEIGLSNISSIERILDVDRQDWIGRWLWRSIKSKSDRHALAERKLLGGGHYTDVGDRMIGSTLVACASIRIPFEIRDYHLASKLVASHLQYCLFISDNRQYIRTSYGVEPLLAVTSRDLTHDAQMFTKMVEEVANRMLEGSLDTGEKGELAMCLVLIRAMDLCITPGFYYQTIDVPLFLRNLIGVDHASTVVKLMDDLAEKANLRSLSKGKFYFNQFLRTRHHRDLSLENCTLAFKQGCALLGNKNHPAYDYVLGCLLPSYISDISIEVALKKYEAKKENMAIAAGQVKNRKNGDDKYPKSAVEKCSSFNAGQAYLPNNCYFTIYSSLYSESESICCDLLKIDELPDICPNDTFVARPKYMPWSVWISQNEKFDALIGEFKTKFLTKRKKKLGNTLIEETDFSAQFLETISVFLFPDEKIRRSLLGMEWNAANDIFNARLELVRKYRHIPIAIHGLSSNLYPCLFDKSLTHDQLATNLLTLAQPEIYPGDLGRKITTAESQKKYADSVTELKK